MKAFDKRVFELKYDFFLNKKISELMGCSEEYIRTTIKKCLRLLIKEEYTEWYHYHK